jgi:hypothetical protein
VVEQTRVETLVRVGASVTVEQRLLVEDARVADRVERELLFDLHRTMARLGRLPVEEVVVQRHTVLEMDRVVYVAEVLTRESDQGCWPSVWAAFHEDEQDRRRMRS